MPIKENAIKQKTPTTLANVGVIKAASTYADVIVSILIAATGLSHPPLRTVFPF
jgi:hypothetical protein